MAVTYRVTRLPGAPPRRGGREWPAGESRADLSPREAAAIAADPGYRIDEISEPDRAAPSAAPSAPKPRRRRRPAPSPKG